MIISEKLKMLKCRIGYHKYYLVQELNLWSRKIGCRNCNRYFGMNDDSRCVIDWDKDLEQMYKKIGVI